MDEEQEQTDGLASAEAEDEQDPWSEGGWYFDLPDGAWERQEAKNRALRQNIRANVKQDSAQRVAEAKKNPFTGPSGSFGGWVDDVVAERGPAGKPAEVWGAATDDKWEGTGAAGPESADEWGAEPPAVIVKPSEPGNPAWEFPTAGEDAEEERFDAAPRAGKVTESRAVASEASAEWGEGGMTLEPAGLPPLRRNVLPERTTVSETADDEAEGGEKRSRWDEMFGGVADSSIVDSMRDWQEREKEETARERDVTRLAPELLAPFDWELAEEDKGVPAGTLFTATEHEDEDEAGSGAVEDEGVSPWASKPAASESLEWDDEEPEAAAVAAAPIVPAAAMSATSWDRLAEDADADAVKARKGGFMSRILGRKPGSEAGDGPAWAANGPAEWTARDTSSTAMATEPRPPAPTPTEGDWAEVEGRDDDTPLNYRPAPVSQSERTKAPAAGSASAAPEHPRGWGAPPTDDDGSVRYELPKRFQGRDVWDDSWLEAPGDNESLAADPAVAAVEPAVGLAPQPMIVEATESPASHGDSEGDASTAVAKAVAEQVHAPVPADASGSHYASGPIAELLEAGLPHAKEGDPLPAVAKVPEPAVLRSIPEEVNSPVFEPLAEAAGTIAKPRESAGGFAADSEPPILHAENVSAAEPVRPGDALTQAAATSVAEPEPEEHDATDSPADDAWAAFLVSREPSASESWIKRDREVRRAG